MINPIGANMAANRYLASRILPSPCTDKMAKGGKHMLMAYFDEKSTPQGKTRRAYLQCHYCLKTIKRNQLTFPTISWPYFGEVRFVDGCN